MTDKCDLDNNNLYINPIETCSLASLYKIYNKTRHSDFYTDNKYSLYSQAFSNAYTDINSNFRNLSTNEFIYKYDKNKKDLCFPLKENDNKSPYAINCVIATDNPLYTYDINKRVCTVIPDLKATPDILKYSENKDYIYIDNNDDEYNKFKYKYRNIKAFCDNKWYDWITIPNYHFGNGYLKDTGEFSKEDVRKCYKPCELNKLPYIDNKGIHKCVNKKIADNGVYNKKLNYSPFALINLLGNTQENLGNLYIYMSLDEYYKYNSHDLYEINLNTSILNTCIINTSNGFVSDCTIKPYNNFEEVRTAYSSFNNVIFDNIINVNTFDELKKYEKYDNILTYKNVNFHENDPELITLRGLINYNILSHPILIHTFILSYKIHEFTEKKIFTLTNYTDNTNNNTIDSNITKLNNDNYNVKYIITKLIENNEIYKNNTNKKGLYIERLANILYKSINICYNNKTEFSKNIINKTIEAINKYLLFSDDNLIAYDKLFNYNKLCFDNNTNLQYLPTGYTPVIATIRATYNTYLNILKQGFEIKYYENKSIIINNIDISSQTATDKTKIINFINNYCHFKKETLEEDILCNTNQIYNVEIKNCDYCSNVCTKNKCSTDNRCIYYCKDQCDIYLSDKLKTSSCGSIKEKNKNKTTNISIIDETPLEENSFDFFSQFNKSIKVAISIIFFIILIYIIYIFYEIFGEAILLFFNFVIYYLYFIYNIIVNLPNYNNLWVIVDYKMAEYTKNYNIKRYNKAFTNLLSKN
jgi:hypothetical protein